MKCDPTMTASALPKYSPKFLSVTPDPIISGNELTSLTLSTSLMSAGWPVSLPVTTIPSLWKNAAALAKSETSRSDVTACELQKTEI